MAGVFGMVRGKRECKERNSEQTRKSPAHHVRFYYALLRGPLPGFGYNQAMRWMFLFAFCLTAAEVKLGKPLTVASPLPVSKLLAEPEPYVGKTVQVKGRVTEVCQMAGCWTSLVDPETNKMIRVKVNDGEIVFPKDAVGKTAIAEGVLKKFTLTREQALARARHEAEEQGRKFNPASVKGGATIYQIQGSGAVLLD